MRRMNWTITTLTTLVMAATIFVAPAAATESTVPGLPVYLALGDSWAYGQGAAEPATGGYVAQLDSALEQDLDCLPAESDEAADGCRHLQLLNLARPATDTLPGVTTPAVASEQLPVAIPLLEARNEDANPRNNVEVITLQVGGNDVSGPIQTACILGSPQDCAIAFLTLMPQLETDLDNVVSQLRTAAGDETTIVLGTYDNPVPYCYLAGIPGAVELGAMVLEGTPDEFLDGIHDVVRRVAARYDAEVAEVFGQLGSGDFVGGADCKHPTDTGHDIVTNAFRSAIDG
ncbi:MAG: SGNH/GDSL hydrolase family protein [Actinomycetota bacterium]|nr:SGNH/GDSL hydrolase family protein [Actinomycetota bacterium]